MAMGTPLTGGEKAVVGTRTNLGIMMCVLGMRMNILLINFTYPPIRTSRSINLSNMTDSCWYIIRTIDYGKWVDGARDQDTIGISSLIHLIYQNYSTYTQ